MDKYQESLIKSMELLAGSMDKKSQGTGTYEGTIVDIIDDESYYVDFRGNKIRCYTSNINLKYTIGERVIFIVPQNNFNEHKTIVGSSTPGSTTYNQEEDMTGWINVSGNLFKKPKFDSDTIYNLSTHWDKNGYYTNGQWHYETIDLDLSMFKNVINQYINNGYTSYSFNFKLFTNIEGGNQAYGNYGVRLLLKYKIQNNNATDEGTKVIVIDNDNILGNPYRQEDVNYTEQFTRFTLKPGMEITGAQLEFFTEGFPIQITGGEPSEDEHQLDIYIKDIQLNALDTVANMNGIHLSIVSEQGFYLTSDYDQDNDIPQGEPGYDDDQSDDDISYTELKPYLIVNGEVVDLDSDSIEDISWYEEDDRINSKSPYYREEGGIQWKCINSFDQSIDNDDTESETTEGATGYLPSTAHSTLEWDSESGALVRVDEGASDVNIDDATGEPKIIFSTKQKSIIVKRYEANSADEASISANTEVYLSKQIKCVLNYKGAYITSVVTIVNLDELKSTDIYLHTANNQYIYSPQLGNVNMVCTLTNPGTGNALTSCYYYWSLYNRNMQLEPFNSYTVTQLNALGADDSINTTIQFPTHLIDDYCFIKVSVYFPIGDRLDDNSGLLVGSKLVALSTSDELSYILGVDNSEVIYKYDKDGDSPLTDDLYDGPASSKIKDTKPFYIRIYNIDGTEIDSANYKYAIYKWVIPKNNTLLVPLDNADEDIELTSDDNFYYYNGRQLKYTIADKYKRDKINNTIILSVEYDGIILNQAITIQFIKDYFDGIEGSKYSLFLELDENSSGNGTEGECFAYEAKDERGIHKLRLYKNGSGNWYYAFTNYGPYNATADTEDKKYTLPNWGQAYFRIRLYRDGERLELDNSKIEWKMFGNQNTGLQINAASSNDKTKAILSGDPNPTNINIIQVSYIVSEGGADNKKTYRLYAYYPIECVVIGTTVGVENLKVAPTIDYGFNTVIYTAEGVNPQYDYAYDYSLNYGDIDNSYFSNKITNTLRENFKNKLGWKGNSDNFDDKQSVIKPAQKYNRNTLNNRIELLNHIVYSTAEIQNKINEIEIKLEEHAAKYQWDTATATKWGAIEEYISDNFSSYLHSCLENRENKNELKIITNEFYNGLINGTINIQDYENKKDQPLIDFDLSIKDIYENINNIKEYNYHYLTNFFINPLISIINIHFTINNNKEYKVSDILKNKYIDEEEKYADIRERCEQEQKAYKNLKLLAGNTLSFYQPVAFVYDVEMLAEIEDYDGTQKIGTGSQELNIINQGAGRIDSSGFSGIALGSIKDQGKLIGYCHNQQTFTLDRHGNLSLLGNQRGRKTGAAAQCKGEDGDGGNLLVEGNTKILGRTNLSGDVDIDGCFYLNSAGFMANNMSDDDDVDNLGALYSQYSADGYHSYSYASSVSGIGSQLEDSFGFWCGYQGLGTGDYSFTASNKKILTGTLDSNNNPASKKGENFSCYARNLSIGGAGRGVPTIGFSDDGSAAFAQGAAYIDKTGNFVSPNLICGVANGSDSAPGLGLGYIGSNQGQLAVAGGSITACGNIPITITGDGGNWGGIKINSQNALAAPRLKLVKGEAANKPVLYNGWIKINNQDIYINGPITLPSSKSDTIKKDGRVEGECGGSATTASIYYTYTVSKGEGTTAASITISCVRVQGTGEAPECECDCDETKSGDVYYYTWNGSEKVYWDYSNGVFSWNLKELENPTENNLHSECEGEPCEDEEE